MPENNYDYPFLLNEFRKIWNNRLFDLGKGNEEEILKEVIRRELQDMNSHPRVRKHCFEKYFSAVNKIVHSSLLDESKLQLIQLHNELMEELNNKEN